MDEWLLRAFERWPGAPRAAVKSVEGRSVNATVGRSVAALREAVSVGRTRLLHKTAAVVRAYASRERLALAMAADHLARHAILHRAAEVLVGRKLRSSEILTKVLEHYAPDERLCAALARREKHEIGAEWAARVFGWLFKPAERRVRGQFFTPSEIAAFMTRWAIRGSDDDVLDPGSGPGTLLHAASARLRELGSLSPSHLLHGVEACPLARTFAAICLYPDDKARPHVHEADFLLEYAPRRRFNAIVCNPPYTRHQGLPAAYKKAIGNMVDAVVGGHLSRRAGLYVHFLIRAVELLTEGGRLAFVTPREFLDAHYGHVPKRFLLERCRLRGLIVFDPAATAAFPGVDTTTAITLLERGVPDGEPVRVVHVREVPAVEELQSALENSGGSFAWGWVEHLPRENFLPEARWSRVLPGQENLAEAEGEVPLVDLVTVKRGIATGANRFFLLTHDEVQAARIPKLFLRPTLGRSRLATGTRVTQEDLRRWSKQGERVWLLDVRGKVTDPAVKAYLARGVRAKVHHRFLCRQRTRWYELERREPPPILMTYMSKGAPRFLRNDAKVLPLNVFHGLYPKGLSERQVVRLLAHLRSDAFRQKLRAGARTYADGLLKVEPGELCTMRVPDVRRSGEYMKIVQI